MTRAHTTLLACLLSAALLSFAGGAEAATELSQGPIAGTPALAGDAVIYGQTGPRRVPDPPTRVMSLPVGGGAPTLLETVTAANQARIDLAGAPGHVVLGSGNYSNCSGDGEAFSGCYTSVKFSFGAPAGLTIPATGCYPKEVEGGFGIVSAQPMVAASGSRVAWAAGAGPMCADGSAIHVRDLAAPGTQDIVLAGAVGPSTTGIAMAGERLATFSASPREGIVRLYDLTTSGLIYERKVPVLGPLLGLAVHSDGTVALNVPALTGPGEALCESLVTYLLFDPAGTQRCGVAAAGVGVELVDGALIGYQFFGRRIALVAQNLATGSRKVIRYSGNSFEEPFDFDGTRVAWSQAGCLASSLWVADVATIAKPEPSPRCVVRTRTKTLKVRNFKRTSITLSCPKGCEGSLSIGGKLGDKLVRRDELGVVDDLTGADPGKLTRMRLTFTPFVQRYLRRHRPRRIALEFHNWGASADGRGGPQVFKIKARYQR